MAARGPRKSEWVHYVLSNNAHRPALVVRVWEIEGADMPQLGLVVFLDGRNDTAEGAACVHANLVKYASIDSPFVNTWHPEAGCYGHDKD